MPQRRAGVRSGERGRGTSDQIGLARRITPSLASHELGLARALRDDLAVTGQLRPVVFTSRTADQLFGDSPIRDYDHVQRHADDGPTTTANGIGACRRFNLVKEMPGWSTEVVNGTDPPDGRPHRIRITTPTGKTYWSESPPVHGTRPAPPPELSGLEIYLAGRLRLAG